ncbi:hypothetical protein CTAYLR_004869 [Chrysophaeum taylorii]|uniref:AMP-dependent synthetase/ligase domain-containing protein n=1 Tax=Chrysophaeum taylorii TaxID=2483200 RepID=A0AAD7XIX9_9STRA|nr:hypothetical protein CTAYLR_004869 [Chrysophaeum taylorii]
MGASYLGLVEDSVSRLGSETLMRWVDDSGNESESVTYGAFWERAGGVSSAVRSWGAGPGDRIIACYLPGIEFYVGFAGCLRGGVIAVPVYPPDPTKLTRALSKLELVVASCGARVALCDDAVAMMRLTTGLVYEWPAELTWHSTQGMRRTSEVFAPAPLAFLQFTSGTTSDPKGCMISFENLDHNVCSIILPNNAKLFGMSSRYDGARPVGLSWLPQYHDMGLVAMHLAPLVGGYEIVYMSPLTLLARPEIWCVACTKFRPLYSGGPDFFFRLVARRGIEKARTFDLSSLLWLGSGAERPRPDTMTTFFDAMRPAHLDPSTIVGTGYGLAEHVVGVSSCFRRVDDLVTSAARPDLACCGEDMSVVLKIVKDAKEVRAGEIGEIWVSSPSVAEGYWGKPELSAAVFRARLDDDDDERVEYLRTGDLGFLDEDGRLFVCGRLKNMIVIRGRNVFSEDVEVVAQEARPNDIRPGCVAAFGRRDDDDDDDDDDDNLLTVVFELRDDARERFERVARDVAAAVCAEVGTQPRVVAIEERSIPKTTSGKVRRQATRDALAAGELKVISRCVAQDDIVVVGAGIVGLAFARDAAALFPQRTIVVLEASDRVGGVWRRNAYPGLRLHAPGASYRCLSVAPKWGNRRPSGEEVLEYAQTLANHPRIEVRTGVAYVGRDATDDAILVKTAGGETLRAAFLFLSTGYSLTSCGQPVMPCSNKSRVVAHSSAVDEQTLSAADRVVVVGAGKTALDVLQGLDPERGVVWAHRGHVAFLDRDVVEAVDDDGEEITAKLAQFLTTSKRVEDDDFLLRCDGPMTRRATKFAGGIASRAEIAHANRFKQMRLVSMTVDDGVARLRGEDDQTLTVDDDKSRVVCCTGQRNDAVFVDEPSVASACFSSLSAPLTALVPLALALEHVSGGNGSTARSLASRRARFERAHASITDPRALDTSRLAFLSTAWTSSVLRDLRSLDVVFRREWTREWCERDLDVADTLLALGARQAWFAAAKAVPPAPKMTTPLLEIYADDNALGLGSVLWELYRVEAAFSLRPRRDCPKNEDSGDVVMVADSLVVTSVYGIVAYLAEEFGDSGILLDLPSSWRPWLLFWGSGQLPVGTRFVDFISSYAVLKNASSNLPKAANVDALVDAWRQLLVSLDVDDEPFSIVRVLCLPIALALDVLDFDWWHHGLRDVHAWLVRVAAAEPLAKLACERIITNYRSLAGAFERQQHQQQQQQQPSLSTFRGGSGGTTAAVERARDAIIYALTTELGDANYAPATKLLDLGLSSLSLVRLRETVLERLRIPQDALSLQDLIMMGPSIQALAEGITTKLQQLSSSATESSSRSSTKHDDDDDDDDDQGEVQQQQQQEPAPELEMAAACWVLGTVYVIFAFWLALWLSTRHLDNLIFAWLTASSSLTAISCATHHLVRVAFLDGASKIPLRSPAFVAWWVTQRLHSINCVVFLDMLRRTPLLNVYFRLLGASIGSEVVLDTAQLLDPSLTRIGARARVGPQTVVRAHRFDAKRGILELDPVVIASDVVVGTRAVVGGGSVVPSNSRVSSLAVVSAATNKYSRRTAPPTAAEKASSFFKDTAMLLVALYLTLVGCRVAAYIPLRVASSFIGVLPTTAMTFGAVVHPVAFLFLGIQSAEILRLVLARNFAELLAAGVVLSAAFAVYHFLVLSLLVPAYWALQLWHKANAHDMSRGALLTDADRLFASVADNWFGRTPQVLWTDGILPAIYRAVGVTMGQWSFIRTMPERLPFESCSITLGANVHLGDTSLMANATGRRGECVVEDNAILAFGSVVEIDARLETRIAANTLVGAMTAVAGVIDAGGSLVVDPKALAGSGDPAVSGGGGGEELARLDRAEAASARAAFDLESETTWAQRRVFPYVGNAAMALTADFCVVIPVLIAIVFAVALVGDSVEKPRQNFVACVFAIAALVALEMARSALCRPDDADDVSQYKIGDLTYWLVVLRLAPQENFAGICSMFLTGSSLYNALLRTRGMTVGRGATVLTTWFTEPQCVKIGDNAVVDVGTIVTAHQLRGACIEYADSTIEREAVADPWSCVYAGSTVAKGQRLSSNTLASVLPS